MRPPLIVGNWKMHGTQAEARSLARQIRRGLEGIRDRDVEVALAPPFTALNALSGETRGNTLRLAAQNVHWEEEGAFTGEISSKMLKELGCSFVIVGHSERRLLLNESDPMVGKKLSACLRSGLRPILCVGETLQQRSKGATRRVIARQLRSALKGHPESAIEKIDIAYEPVWAIGTGRNATADQVGSAHRWIQRALEQRCGKKFSARVRILYGGSVRPDNAADLARLPEVNGFLVGGASLKAESFLKIVRCFL